ncbi:MAG: 16S rRNA (adenine(1518)-N(6)/adenine(1519)-N(6))-dimethyltransferase RsmA [Clostridiales bacterium]|nr:16S rRNA (adenine(1518)-N(6)/adenine(1519)-N(6))-dimethyltransferase RsmA [Clostridiales bacterium]
MNLCDINEIKTILSRNGFHFSKSLGQNFLIAPWVPEKIAEECEAKCAAVLEVGPGIGCLTAELAKRAEKVIAVELDRSLLPVLRETLNEYKNIEIVNHDILKLDIKKTCDEIAPGMPLVACANLPYYITTPVLAALFEAGIFKYITVMVQKEVAERLAATPGKKAYGAFTVFANYYAEAEILFSIPPDCFIPQPKVTSAVVKFKMREAPPPCILDRNMFFAVVKAAFSQRRKTLLNCLSSYFARTMSKKDMEDILNQCNISPDIRGERLSLEQFATIANEIRRLDMDFKKITVEKIDEIE